MIQNMGTAVVLHTQVGARPAVVAMLPCNDIMTYFVAYNCSLLTVMEIISIIVNVPNYKPEHMHLSSTSAGGPSHYKDAILPV